MKYIKTHKLFIESILLDSNIEEIIDITESLKVVKDSILDCVSAEECDMIDIFKYDNKEKTIDSLVEDNDFLDSISKIGLRMSDINNTDDFETFISKTIKFILLYKKEYNDLSNPEYIITQTWNDETNKWSEISLFKINDDIKKFYDKLSSKTIEITLGEKNYIYKTSNSGNNWELQNRESESKDFRLNMSRDDLKLISKINNIKINII